MIRFARRRPQAMAPRPKSLETSVINPSACGDPWQRLGEIERNVQEILAALDDLGLHQPAAYVSMGLDLMRQARLNLLRTG
jgi:hypothetical protein